MQLNQFADIDSVVLAGGKASRIGGIDKTLLPLGLSGKTLLEDVIAACPGQVYVIGPKREIASQVKWVSDLVESGGPAAGIWAGLQKINTKYVFISAGDQQLTSNIVINICQAAVGQDGAWALREDGSGQPLLACVETNKLRELLSQTEGVNASPLRLMNQLNMVGVKVHLDQVIDIDSWADVARIAKEQKLSDITPIWLKQVASILDISESEIPVNELLDLTREVAHNVERKSAPLTTYLIGLASAKEGANTEDLIKKISSAVSQWEVSELNG